MDEDALLTFFEKVNVNMGNLSPTIIKAWFDTDCGDLLKWISTSITEESYISAQQEFEFSQYDVLPNDQLQKKMNIIENEYPDIFEVGTNLFEIEFSNSTIEMLQEELEEHDHQISINQELHHSLLAELALITRQEMQSQLAEESAQDNCVALIKEFDNINSQTYDQILKYGSYLRNYEFAEIPEFANNVDIFDFEQKFSNTVLYLNSLMQIPHDSFETSCVKYLTDTLCELQNRIFQSKVSLLALQMEVEALNSTLSFLDNYNVSEPSIDHELLVLSIGVSRDQQTSTLSIIEESLHKLAQHFIKQPTLQCLKNEFEYFQLKLNYINKSREGFAKILFHFIIMHAIYLQEKHDINSSSQFFRNIRKNVNIDISDTNFRTEAMMKLISQYEEFCLSPFENKLKLMDNFRAILLKGDHTSPLVDVLESIRWNNKRKKDQWFSVQIDEHVLKTLCRNIQTLKKFLICGPTSQIVTVPTPLQSILFRVNQNLGSQHTSIKLLVQAAQKPKEKISKDKWLKYQNLLWTYFMTDFGKLVSFLEQLKADQKLSREKELCLK